MDAQSVLLVTESRGDVCVVKSILLRQFFGEALDAPVPSVRNSGQ